MNKNEIIESVNNSKKDNNGLYICELMQFDAQDLICILHNEKKLSGFNSKSEIKNEMYKFFEENCNLNPLSSEVFKKYKGRADTEFAQRLGNNISNLSTEIKNFLKENPGEKIIYGKLEIIRIHDEYYMRCLEDEDIKINVDPQQKISILNNILSNNFRKKNTLVIDLPKDKKQESNEANKVLITRNSIIAETMKSFFENKCLVHHDKKNMELVSFLISDEIFYTEGHHIIPLSEQNKFSNDLDDYWNVIPLCSKCHRLLHHGLDDEKEKILKVILLKYDEGIGQSFLSIFNKFLKAEKKEEFNSESSLINYLLKVY